MASGISTPAFDFIPAVATVRHPWLYFEDGNIVLSVQTVLFKVHRHFLTEYSPVFKNMWALASVGPKDGDGSNDDNPILLNGDNPEDFSSLLQLFYHRTPGSAVSLTAVQWRSVLAVATKYEMETIRQKAIQELKVANPPLDPVDQIIAARKYGCMDLAETPMKSLVKREQPLSIQEVVKLSPEDLHKWIMERDKSRIRKQVTGEDRGWTARGWTGGWTGGWE